MSEPNADYLVDRERGVSAWAAINKDLMKWWRDNRNRMTYDQKDGHWHLEKK